MAYAASSAWLVSWDKFVIPRPFARIVIAIGAPRSVPRTLASSDAATMTTLQEEMEQELHRLARLAREALG
jgi:lysophospholipid acyltransferase (LPLAT)-like uncharacterized protein